MIRSEYKIPLGDNLIKYKVKVIDEDSIIGSDRFRIRKLHFLNEILQTHGILNYGYREFDRLLVYHDGQRWVAESECIEEENGERSKENSTQGTKRGIE